MTKECLAYKIGMSRFGDKGMEKVTKLIDDGHTGLAESVFMRSLMLPYLATLEGAAGFQPIELES